MNLEKLVGKLLSMSKDRTIAAKVICAIVIVATILQQLEQGTPETGRPETVEQFEAAIQDASTASYAYQFYINEMREDLPHLNVYDRYKVASEIERLEEVSADQMHELATLKREYKLLKLLPPSEDSVQ